MFNIKKLKASVLCYKLCSDINRLKHSLDLAFGCSWQEWHLTTGPARIVFC